MNCVWKEESGIPFCYLKFLGMSQSFFLTVLRQNISWSSLYSSLKRPQDVKMKIIGDVITLARELKISLWQKRLVMSDTVPQILLILRKKQPGKIIIGNTAILERFLTILHCKQHPWFAKRNNKWNVAGNIGYCSKLPQCYRHLQPPQVYSLLLVLQTLLALEISLRVHPTIKAKFI
jgi:hypothetical protein